MTTTQIFQTAGTVIGYYFGGPVGGAIGGTIGGLIGGSLEPDIVSRGPRMEDRRVQVSTYGSSIPYLFGTTRVAGNVIWAADITETTSEDSIGGKGGPSNSQITYNYFGTWAVLIGKGELRGVRRIWADAVLMFDGSIEPPLGDVHFSFYGGSEDQLPDPTIEAALGVGNTPAFRGSAYIVIRSLPLEKFGNRLPSITIEVTGDGLFQGEGTKLGPDPQFGSDGGAGVQYDLLIMGAAQRNDKQVVVMTYPNSTGPAHTPGIKLTLIDHITGNEIFSVTHESLTGNNEVIDQDLMTYVPPLDEVWVAGWDPVVYRFNAATFAMVGTTYFMDGSIKLEWEPYSRRVYSRPGSSWIAAGGRYVVLGAGIQNIDVVRLFNVSPPPVFEGGPPGEGPYELTDACTIDLEGQVHYESMDAQITSVPLDGFGGVDAAAQSCMACFDITRSRYVICTGGTRIWTVTDADPPVITAHTLDDDAQVYIIRDVSYDSALDVIIILSQVVGIVTLLVLDASTFNTLYVAHEIDGESRLGTAFAFPSEPGSMLIVGNYQTWRLDYFGNTVGQAVARLANDSGLTPADYDVSELTQDLRGFIISQPGPVRGAIEQLARDFWFTGVEEDDILYFRRRGGPVVATIAAEDCGAGLNDDRPQAISKTRAQELDLPAHLAVTASDPALDYQPGTQYAERRAGFAGEDEGISSAVVMTADDGKRLADGLLFDRWAGRESFRWSTTRKHARLSPGDPILLGDRRVRITTRNDDGGAIRWEGRSDDADVVNQLSTGINGDFPGQTPSIQVPTIFEVLDMTLLSDDEDHAGAYVAAYGVAPHWRGGVIYNSTDGVGWTRLATMPRPGSAMGVTTDALADWTGGNVFDEASHVNVVMRNGNTLSSTTRASVLAGNNAIAVWGTDGWEVVQYRQATLEVDDSYTLSGMLRGRRGTEYATGGHAAGDHVVVLSEAGIADLALGNSYIGLWMPYKAVSIGDSLADTPSVYKTVYAERLKPWSPVDYRVSFDIVTNDATLTWKRRTRLACRYIGGINVPLGEAAELYDVEITPPGGTTVLRTFAGLTSAEVVYTAAQRLADGVGDVFGVNIYQISDVVGRGHPLVAGGLTGGGAPGDPVHVLPGLDAAPPFDEPVFWDGSRFLAKTSYTGWANGYPVLGMWESADGLEYTLIEDSNLVAVGNSPWFGMHKSPTSDRLFRWSFSHSFIYYSDDGAVSWDYNYRPLVSWHEGDYELGESLYEYWQSGGAGAGSGSPVQMINLDDDRIACLYRKGTIHTSSDDGDTWVRQCNATDPTDSAYLTEFSDGGHYPAAHYRDMLGMAAGAGKVVVVGGDGAAKMYLADDIEGPFTDVGASVSGIDLSSAGFSGCKFVAGCFLAWGAKSIDIGGGHSLNAGFILRSEDGENWTDVSPSPTYAIDDSLASWFGDVTHELASGRLVNIGVNVTYTSDDDGETWDTSINNPNIEGGNGMNTYTPSYGATDGTTIASFCRLIFWNQYTNVVTSNHKPVVTTNGTSWTPDLTDLYEP